MSTQTISIQPNTPKRFVPWGLVLCLVLLLAGLALVQIQSATLQQQDMIDDETGLSTDPEVVTARNAAEQARDKVDRAASDAHQGIQDSDTQRVTEALGKILAGRREFQAARKTVQENSAATEVDKGVVDDVFGEDIEYSTNRAREAIQRLGPDQQAAVRQKFGEKFPGLVSDLDQLLDTK